MEGSSQEPGCPAGFSLPVALGKAHCAHDLGPGYHFIFLMDPCQRSVLMWYHRQHWQFFLWVTSHFHSLWTSGWDVFLLTILCLIHFYLLPSCIPWHSLTSPDAAWIQVFCFWALWCPVFISVLVFDTWLFTCVFSSTQTELFMGMYYVSVCPAPSQGLPHSKDIIYAHWMSKWVK